MDKGNIAPEHADDFFNLVIEHIPWEKETMGTFADHLRKQGFEKGKLEGVEKGRAEAVLQMIEAGFEPKKIMSVFGLTQKELDNYLH